MALDICGTVDDWLVVWSHLAHCSFTKQHQLDTAAWLCGGCCRRRRHGLDCVTPARLCVDANSPSTDGEEAIDVLRTNLGRRLPRCSRRTIPV